MNPKSSRKLRHKADRQNLSAIWENCTGAACFLGSERSTIESGRLNRTRRPMDVSCHIIENRIRGHQASCHHHQRMSITNGPQMQPLEMRRTSLDEGRWIHLSTKVLSSGPTWWDRVLIFFVCYPQLCAYWPDSFSWEISPIWLLHDMLHTTDLFRVRVGF